MPAIACIGWGSLFWSPGALPVRCGWFEDGPVLPVEFARESEDRRMTLVLVEGASPVRTLWALLNVSDLAEARAALAKREGTAEDKIGWWSPSLASGGIAAGVVATWADGHELDGVVWTGLPHGFKKDRSTVPKPAEVLAHMRGLPEEARCRAEEYVRRAPIQVDTEVRRLLEQELGWTPFG